MNVFMRERRRAEEMMSAERMPGPAHHRRPPAGPGPRLRVAFEEEDMECLRALSGDEDTAAANGAVLMDAPAEIQILAAQLMELLKEVSE